MQNTNYEFVKVVNANVQSVSGRIYYFTYEARDMSDGSDETCSLTFQAKVWQKICEQGIEILLCRIKPTS